MGVHASKLFIAVDHPMWRTELQHRKKQILDNLNEGDPGRITEIVFMDPQRSEAKRLTRDTFKDKGDQKQNERKKYPPKKFDHS